MVSDKAIHEITRIAFVDFGFMLLPGFSCHTPGAGPGARRLSWLASGRKGTETVCLSLRTFARSCVFGVYFLVGCKSGARVTAIWYINAVTLELP